MFGCASFFLPASGTSYFRFELHTAAHFTSSSLQPSFHLLFLMFCKNLPFFLFFSPLWVRYISSFLSFLLYPRATQPVSSAPPPSSLRGQKAVMLTPPWRTGIHLKLFLFRRNVPFFFVPCCMLFLQTRMAIAFFPPAIPPLWYRAGKFTLSEALGPALT